jgi:hypothetical protein
MAKPQTLEYQKSLYKPHDPRSPDYVRQGKKSKYPPGTKSKAKYEPKGNKPPKVKGPKEPKIKKGKEPKITSYQCYVQGCSEVYPQWKQAREHMTIHHEIKRPKHKNSAIKRSTIPGNDVIVPPKLNITVKGVKSEIVESDNSEIVEEKLASDTVCPPITPTESEEPVEVKELEENP